MDRKLLIILACLSMAMGTTFADKPSSMKLCLERTGLSENDIHSVGFRNEK